jgi:hypothetical protein
MRGSSNPAATCTHASSMLGSKLEVAHVDLGKRLTNALQDAVQHALHNTPPLQTDCIVFASASVAAAAAAACIRQ